MCGVIYDHPVYSIQHAKLARVFGYYSADPCCVFDRKIGLAQKYSALFQQAGVYCSLRINPRRLSNGFTWHILHSLNRFSMKKTKCSHWVTTVNVYNKCCVNNDLWIKGVIWYTALQIIWTVEGIHLICDEYMLTLH